MDDPESAAFWSTVNLEKLDVPEEIKKTSEQIEILDDYAIIEDVRVFYRETKTPSRIESGRISVLLLHGAAFSSKTWLDLGTIHKLGAMGYYTVAVDIPGYGQSPGSSIKDKAAFLDKIINHFNLQNPVIVSPSMSGAYALPYLIKHWNKMAGYIPVAPVGIDILEKQTETSDSRALDHIGSPLKNILELPVPDLTFIKVPAMVVFGEKDRGRNSALVNLLPWSQCAEIPGGRHPAYLDNPDLWHKLLYNFLSNLSKFHSKI